MPNIEQLREAVAAVEASKSAKFHKFDDINPIIGANESDLLALAAYMAIDEAKEIWPGARLIVEPNDTVRAKVDEILLSRINPKPVDDDYIMVRGTDYAP